MRKVIQDTHSDPDAQQPDRRLSNALATCVLSFLSAYAIVYFRIRWRAWPSRRS